MFQHFCNQGSPSTCILDTAIVPILSIILAGLFPAIIFLSTFHNAHKCPSIKLFWFLYVFVVFVIFCLQLDEVVRLVLEEGGVGLLPFGLLAQAMAFGLLLHGRRAGRPHAVRALCPYL